MIFGAVRNYYQAMTSLDFNRTRKAFFANIRDSFVPSSRAFYSSVLSLAALVSLALVAAIALTVAVTCLVIALISGMNPRGSAVSKSIFTEGIYFGGLFGISCLLATIIQAFTLPFQLFALPFMLTAAAGKSCFRLAFKKSDNLKAESRDDDENRLNHSVTYLLKKLPKSKAVNATSKRESSNPGGSSAARVSVSISREFVKKRYTSKNKPSRNIM